MFKNKIYYLLEIIVMIAIEHTNFHENNIFICDPIKNSIIQSSLFYKIIYSNKLISMNGIFIIFNLNNVTNIKKKFLFKFEDNINIINYLSLIEEKILNLIDNKKVKLTKIADNLTNGYITYNTDYYFNNNDLSNDISNKFYDVKKFILKISGIWETKENIGITFKFILVDRFI